MYLAKVTGTIVSTQKNENLKGQKILIVHPVDLDYNLIGKKDALALDFVDAGVGDVVLVLQEGDAIQQLLKRKDLPVHTAVVAVVDNIHIGS
ncbi:MAG TPA: EutN/CcmL family microcompartment protein [Bacteroidota bacterium]|jgi:microcompartment protein CcmK/EutM|nr:EutN/CcmL family microcompartment protein [Bacteroidota bacterium]